MAQASGTSGSSGSGSTTDAAAARMEQTKKDQLEFQTKMEEMNAKYDPMQKAAKANADSWQQMRN
jgi:hypothetical protein